MEFKWKNIDCLEEKFGFSAKEILDKLKSYTGKRLLTAADDVELLSEFTGLDEQTCDRILTNVKTSQRLTDFRQSNWEYVTQHIDHNPPQQIDESFYLNTEGEPILNSKGNEHEYQRKKVETEKELVTFIKAVESGKAKVSDITRVAALPGEFTAAGSALSLPYDVLFNMLKANTEIISHMYALWGMDCLYKEKVLYLLDFIPCTMLHCSLENWQAMKQERGDKHIDANSIYREQVQAGVAAAKAQEQSAEMQ